MQLSGFIRDVRHENADKSYYIFSLVLDQRDITLWPDGSIHPRVVWCAGDVVGLTVSQGVWLTLEANPVRDKKFGWQYKIQRAPVALDSWTVDQIANALSDGSTNSLLVRQVERFVGADKLEETLESAELLAKVPGMTDMTARVLSTKWKAAQIRYRSLSFLQDLGLPPQRVRSIWRTLGDSALDLISQNPWDLLQVDGITFPMADGIAHRLGIPLSDPRRMRGAVVNGCKQARSFGHLYVTGGDVFRAVSLWIPTATREAVAAELKTLESQGFCKIDKVGGVTAIYETWFWEIEQESTRLLAERSRLDPLGTPEGRSAFMDAIRRVGPKTAEAVSRDPNDIFGAVDAAISEWEDRSGFVLSNEQRRGVQNSLTGAVSVLTGLPGTGKSSSTKAVVQILEDMGVHILLTAPTGIAAKRLQQVTGKVAQTIHSAFGAKRSGEGDDSTREQSYAGFSEDSTSGVLDVGRDSQWGYGEARYHPAEYVIVDESSMLDQHLLYRILISTSPTCRLLFVGDPAQLPSVGPGDVLRSMAAVLPTVSLSEIFRQKGTSYIVEAAHAVHRGDTPRLDHPDFNLTHLASEEAILQELLRVAVDLSQKGIDFQTISPRHSGTIGVTNLNSELRKVLNPPDASKAEITVQGDQLREGDRVMVVRNDHNLGIANGDIGLVHQINAHQKTVTVSLSNQAHKTLVDLTYQQVAEYLRLAYCVTVHKTQGQEFSHVVFPLVDAFRHQLQRNLFYTAITRAKRQVLLVGHETAVIQAIQNAIDEKRNTLFRERLERDLTR